jgi:ABC-type phosphate transport system substrate-binding protein
MKDMLRMMAVAFLCAVVWSPGVAVGREAPGSGRKAENVVKIRVGGKWVGWSIASDVADEFRRKNPQIGFEYADSRRPGRLHVSDLSKGKTDVAVINGAMLSSNSQQYWMTTKWLKTSKCPAKTIAWRVMAVVVHPENPLNEIDEATLRKILGRKIVSWKSFSRKDEQINLVLDGRVGSVIGILGGRQPKFMSSTRIANVLDKFAKDRLAMGLFSVDKRLTDSGLKILAIKPAGADKAILPSTENVSSEKYPYYEYLAVATRPDAPRIVRDFAEYLRGAKTADKLDSYWLTKLDYTLPGETVEEIWPAANPKADPVKVSGAVAVLPLKVLSAHFLMINSSHHAVYEQAVADGIARDKRLKMVDRAELARILNERKAMLMSGSTRPKKPIITADLLVLSYVITEKSRSYLLVRAVHAATASTLGRMKLPIDPAGTEKFGMSVSKKVAKWWPGVLRNLVAARTRPVWTLLPTDGGKQHGRDQALRVQASLSALLSGDERIFFAQYWTLPKTQQEVLMRLMGMSRPLGGRFTPAGDYLIDSRALTDTEIELQLLRGSDLKVLGKTTIKGDSAPADASAWATGRIKLFSKMSRSTTPVVADRKGSARRQAELQIERGLKLQKQYRTLSEQAYRRYSAKGLSDYTHADKKTLDPLYAEMTRCFERAAQLDPTIEEATFQTARASGKSMGGTYLGILRFAEKHSAFVDTFGKSKHLRGMMEHTIWAYSNLARYLENPSLRNSSLAKTPRGLDYAKLSKQYRRRTLYYLSEYMRRCVKNRDKRGGGSFYTFNVIVESFEGNLQKYAKLGVSDAEIEEVIAGYGRAVDKYSGAVKHSDFYRLHYMAIKQRKQACVALLTKMQKRWSDPKSAPWKLGKDEALEDLCTMFKTDRRGTSFYQWLRGKRGIGDLP